VDDSAVVLPCLTVLCRYFCTYMASWQFLFGFPTALHIVESKILWPETVRNNKGKSRSYSYCVSDDYALLRSISFLRLTVSTFLHTICNKNNGLKDFTTLYKNEIITKQTNYLFKSHRNERHISHQMNTNWLETRFIFHVNQEWTPR
jgi:hypothetical protein